MTSPLDKLETRAPEEREQALAATAACMRAWLPMHWDKALERGQLPMPCRIRFWKNGFLEGTP